ncbi:MAG: acyl-CoA thioesterase [Ignavibacteria bacterium CG_4_8_14_3_um_filter_37_9]|nr:acyl-CoA thioesterase [Ignavibacteria bacterium]OIO15795.1 MAG: thioesterase [Ignavibacteria bacterium CG1_02_37_35]PIP78386.1 MAG: thioesterase [Ignavibacteria bacterium CG22_combo_CG10-13_8_21_14_all_37_15]PIW99083.1 MAG: acyl-CoA thioesterase [Ignavibacteria bacterium CG_4_8_14_3_um_filter_37_9]PIX94634.1 MAG: acyl-CoA thioesterase [Ignavibacteria bacterium CG_4_10_14_3_um_filter_37_18]PJC59242.1 MAG: acyl-CoA thioesterase [Ignavibacteria bacterium CG_4_9_14_0_2_um_filter_37_13]
MLKHISTIRVRYADTDKMQFVYNGKYLEYFEVGRTELLRSLGLPYSEVEKQGYQLPVVEASVKYKSPAHYDDLLEIETMVKELPDPKFRIHYVIRNMTTPDTKIVAEGFTDHLFIKTETKRPTRPPKFYMDIILPFYQAK